MGSSFSSGTSRDASLGAPFSFFGFLGFFSFFSFFSLLVGFYTLILVSRQCLCLGVRRTFPSVFATTQDGTACACFSAWDRCFFFPDGLCRATCYALLILISVFWPSSCTSVFF